MSFETEFFGPGNRLRWDAIQSGLLPVDVQQRLGPFLEDMQRNPEVLVLPRVREDGRVQWYVLCRSSRAARIARDEVRGFLGPTYSDFEGRPTHLDLNDTVEAAVLAAYGTDAFRIEVPDREILDAARARLRLLVRLRSERPTRHAQHLRAAGRVLRDFEYALLAEDGAAATACIEELRFAGYLSATNLLFLEVRRLAAGRHWDAILALPEFHALLTMLRPRRVTEALVRAVYWSFLQEFEEGKLASQAIDRFKSDIFDRFRDLYRSRAGISGYEIDASFLMAAVTSTPPRAEIAEQILAGYPTDSPGRDYLTALAQLLPSTVSQTRCTLLEDARAAFAEADVDRACELAKALPPSFDRCALLLRCARDMGTLSAAQVALQSLDTLLDRDRTRIAQHVVLSRIRDSLANLSTEKASEATQPTIAEDIPSDWSTWFKRLTASDPWKGAIAVAETGAREWSIESFLRNPSAVQEATDLLLGERPQWGQVALRDAIPYFLEFCMSAGVDVRLKQVYESLFLTVALDAQVSLPQVAALLKIADARLRLGVQASDYLEILSQLASSIRAVESPSVADIALEALEIVINAACPLVTERQQFLIQVVTVFQRWYRRIDSAQFTLLRSFSEELGMLEAISGHELEVSSDSASQEWAPLVGKRIAMYSLQESALRRAARIMSEICPSVRVDTFHDEVGGSPALRIASATADVFVLAIAAAKHSATLFIESRRPKELITLYARGQGSTGMLRALREYVANR